MSADKHDSAVKRQRVDEVIATYMEAVDAGQPPDPMEFIAQHGDLADELASFFADCNQFERFAEPLQAETSVTIGTQARYFGDYELLEEIDRGGMGVVFKARQISLNRIVALKMILAGQLASPEDVRRFYVEAEAAANLDHPGIVPIYEVGEQDGHHYFSMGYVDGDSLATRLREGPLSAQPAATVLKQVCEAVQYAHEHDVIHRDLKPANILLERSGPRITDFGLAKRLASDSDLTDTGQIIGTPNYMSPEQAGGATQTIGPASDVFSLGAILYQLLTGRPPFQADTPLETLSQLLDSDPLPPRLLNRNVPHGLEAICMKCLEKEPSRRYFTARHLGDDLQRFLDGDAITAAPINLLDRMTRALRQSRHEEHFRGWGFGLMGFGLVIFLSHLAIFVLEQTWHDHWATYLLPRMVMFAALLIMLWRFRPHSLLPTNSAERLMWVVWTAYLLGLAAVNVARSVFGHDYHETYATSAVLTGFGFLIMGAHIWGGGYVVGLIFMVAAPMLALYVDVAPLAFGTLWAVALLTFGVHYWRLEEQSK